MNLTIESKYEKYDVGHLIDLTHHFGFIDAKQRIYNIVQSIVSGLAKPCEALEEINSIGIEIQDMIFELIKPIDEEQLQLLNPMFDVE